MVSVGKDIGSSWNREGKPGEPWRKKLRFYLKSIFGLESGMAAYFLLFIEKIGPLTRLIRRLDTVTDFQD